MADENATAPDAGRTEPGADASPAGEAGIVVDVAILGAGIAGCAAASALSRQGIEVALIAQHARHPPEFRAEKAGEALLHLLGRLGLGEPARAHMTAFDGVWLHRFGRIVDRGRKREYGFDYPALVDALRRALPPAVRTIVGRSESIDSGPVRQVVRLRDGRTVSARLLIMATGLGLEARRQAGVGQEVISRDHTLAAGFTLAREPASFPFPSLVWTGERFGDRVSYLTLFPLGRTMRANFYVYRTQNEAWTQRLREAPDEVLRASLPGLARAFGDIRVAGPVVTRPVDLYRVTDHLRDGLVFVGDAFCTACPITSTGIAKALTDVDRLCHVHVPHWLAAPGMSRDKIAAYYTDPVKQASDRRSLAQSVNARRIKTERSLAWRLRRLKSNTLVRMLYYLPANRFLEKQ